MSVTQLLFDVQFSDLDALMNTKPDECSLFLNGNLATLAEVLQAVQTGKPVAITGRWIWFSKGGFRLESSCPSGGPAGFNEETRRLWFVAPRRLISAVMHETRPLTLTNSISDVSFSIHPTRIRSVVVIGDATAIPTH